MSTTFRSLKIAAATAATGLCMSGASVADPSAGDYSSDVTTGRATMYQQLPQLSLEHLTTPDHIMAITQGNAAPTEIWRALEHGEKVECLGCIPGVANLLYDGNAKTREIAAWWLRRRIFGVFGPGEVYSQVLGTLTSGTTDESRADAAQALGEFLIADGIAPVAKAAVSDTSAVVRLSAVKALQRLNTEGPAGELATAISDASPDVRLAALGAVVNVNVFVHVDAVVTRLSDESSDVRREAAEVLGTLHSSDAVVGLIALTRPAQEADPRVRTSAVGALGKIGDPAAHGAVTDALQDSDPLVQSMAMIALRRL